MRAIGVGRKRLQVKAAWTLRSQRTAQPTANSGLSGDVLCIFTGVVVLECVTMKGSYFKITTELSAKTKVEQY